MAQTLLQLVQNASNELGLTAPSNVIGSYAADTIQMLALVNALGNELQREFDWNALEKEYRFYTTIYSYTATTVSGSAVLTIPSTAGIDTTFMVTGAGVNQDCYVESVSLDGVTLTLNQPMSVTGSPTLTFAKTKYAMPADYDRIVDRTQWDKTRHWEMIGPLSSQQWQFLKSAFISTGPRVRWRMMGNMFQIWPLLGTSEYLGFDYISNGWVTDTTGNTKSNFSLDTDMCIYPDRLMTLGLKLKYFEIKGFDTSSIRHDYQGELDRAKAMDGGSATLSFAPAINSILIGWNNIPDSGYGS